MIFLIKLKDGEKSRQVFVEALSYTEAETYARQIQKVICNDQFSELEQIVKTTFREILLMDLLPTDKETNKIHYKAKVAYITETNSGKKKTNKYFFVLQASSFEDAYQTLKEFADGFMDDARSFSLEEIEVEEYYDKEDVLGMEADKFATQVLEGKVEFGILDPAKDLI